jgi:hypothetical protein
MKDQAHRAPFELVSLTNRYPTATLRGQWPSIKPPRFTTRSKLSISSQSLHVIMEQRPQIYNQPFLAMQVYR